MEKDKRHIDVNWPKVVYAFQLVLGVVILTGWISWFGGTAQVSISQKGFTEGFRYALNSMLGWMPLLQLFLGVFSLVTGLYFFRKLLRQPLLVVSSNPADETVVPGEKAMLTTIPKYERDAFLSYVKAIQECPTLDTPRKIFDWIKSNGVEIDGVPYTLPAFDTWRKYRSEGEKKAKSASA